ncbi:hypothetical protein ACSQ67_020775 [Phaseolus vulgaris]
MLLENFYNIFGATELKSEFWTSWQPLESPCLVEHVILPVELGFFVILLVQILRKYVNLISKDSDGATKLMHPTAIKYGFSYKVSIVCNTLLLGVHAALLLLMLNHETQCTSKLQAFTSEIVQVLSWATSVIAICKISKSSTHFPWILRAWWLCNFIVCVISTGLHVHFSVTNNGEVSIREYADFLGLLASTCLLVISTRGKTGTVMLATNGAAEPLLGEKTEKHSECRKESPYGKATLLQLINFSWLNPLFAIGYKKPLEQNDIPDVDIKDSAEFLTCSFDESLRQECLMGILKEKTIIFVTHQVEFLPAADLILVMQNGRITQAGKFDDLLKQNIGFEVLVGAHSKALESIVVAENSSRTSFNSISEEGESNFNSRSSLQLENTQHDKVQDNPPEDKGNDGKLVQEEERETGFHRSKCVRHGNGKQSRMVCFLNNTDSRNYCRDVSGGMASICHLHSSNCSLHMRYYTPTARELARLAQIQITPILHHFSESLAGAASIRAFDQEGRFIYTNLILVDGFSRPWFHNVSAMEWLSFRLNLLSNFVFAFSLVMLVTLPEEIINPSIAGLAVTYGINLNVLQASVIWNICNAENKMISVERILQYTNITSEAPLVIEDSRPPSNWPETGTICFKNLQIRYAEHLPSVLKNITCTFPGRKKVGVVGRTGSGKSTLIQAIFRIVEPREGSIIIDNVDICKIGLHDLRSRLSIIPQDPALFEGTVRGNLDPLQHYSDIQVWEALDKCQLGHLVRAKEEKLDSPVVENGDNWSVGQRQLFCLGRALLKRSSILVLDEATASVDSATDGVLQNIISQEFKDRTVVTIAHRIHTVIDSDLVLVLSDGRIAEYDEPSRLLEREDSFFFKLIKEYSGRSHSFNSLATQHVQSREQL